MMIKKIYDYKMAMLFKNANDLANSLSNQVETSINARNITLKGNINTLAPIIDEAIQAWMNDDIDDVPIKTLYNLFPISKNEFILRL